MPDELPTVHVEQNIKKEDVPVLFFQWVLVLQRLADIESRLHDVSDWNIIDSYKVNCKLSLSIKFSGKCYAVATGCVHSAIILNCTSAWKI